MKIPKVSIIVVAYDFHRLQRQITSACLGNISKYTDREDYELLLIDQYKNENGKVIDLDIRHQFIDINKHIKIKHIGMSAAMNLGVKNSIGNYLCFMHNDVFIWEGWLKTLLSKIEGMEDAVVMPHQGPTPREWVLESYQKEGQGNDDAGLIMMSRKTFDKTGGWDERFKAIYQDVPFRMKFPNRFLTTNQCIITHIGCGTAYALSEQEERDAYNEESKIFNEIRK